MSIANLIRERFGLDLRDFAGAMASGEIPLANGVVNGFIAAELARRQLPVQSLKVDAHEGDTLTAYIVPRARFVPPLRLHVRVERQPNLPVDPVLWLRWSMPGAGPLALFAAPALAFFKALPPGIRADGDRLAIDVREMLNARGLGEALRFLRNVRVHTRAGAIVVKFEIGVPEE